MTTPSTPPAGTSTSAVTENDLFLMFTTLFSESRPIPGKNSCESPRIRVGRPAMSGLSRSPLRSSSGSTLYLVGLDQPEPLELRQQVRMLGGQVAGLAEVGGAVVELPVVVVEGRHVAGRP